MGEALISRSGGGGSDDDSSIVVIPTHHSILVTVKGPGNKGLAVNYPVSCKDGATYYNYTTNTKGQVLFMCNSGSANILTANYINGIRYIDVSNKWTNIAAPVGSSTKLNIELNRGQASVSTTVVYNFTTAVTRAVNIALVGGGGGGGSGVEYDERWYGGGGGGAGYLNWYNNYTIESGNVYSFRPGSGGSRTTEIQQNGGTGGTSVILNTSMSAIGGRGGGNSWSNRSTGWYGKGGEGGLGNGGDGSSNRSISEAQNGKNSSVSFAGGGGGALGRKGGTPYGGTSPYDSAVVSATGMGGGGGGSGTGSGSSDYRVSGSGYNGGMVINITY